MEEENEGRWRRKRRHAQGTGAAHSCDSLPPASCISRLKAPFPFPLPWLPPRPPRLLTLSSRRGVSSGFGLRGSLSWCLRPAPPSPSPLPLFPDTLSFLMCLALNGLRCPECRVRIPLAVGILAYSHPPPESRLSGHQWRSLGLRSEGLVV